MHLEFLPRSLTQRRGSRCECYKGCIRNRAFSRAVADSQRLWESDSFSARTRLEDLRLDEPYSARFCRQQPFPPFNSIFIIAFFITYSLLYWPFNLFQAFPSASIVSSYFRAALDVAGQRAIGLNALFTEERPTRNSRSEAAGGAGLPMHRVCIDERYLADYVLYPFTELGCTYIYRFLLRDIPRPSRVATGRYSPPHRQVWRALEVIRSTCPIYV